MQKKGEGEKIDTTLNQTPQVVERPLERSDGRQMMTRFQRRFVIR